MNLNKINEFFDSTQDEPDKEGKTFRVAFIKRNNRRRVIMAKLGVQHNLTYTGQSYDPRDRGMRTVWSVKDKGYRNIPLDSIYSLQIPDESGNLVEVLNEN